MTANHRSHRGLAAAIAPILLTALAIVAAVAPAEAQLRRGEKSFGPKVGYVSYNKAASAGLMFQYTFGGHFRMTPEVGIVFRNKDLDAFTVDLNAHVPFGFEDNKVVLYPLAGANYTSWNRHDMEDAEHNDVSTHINRFGINAGAGIELRCTKSLKLSLEGKYCFNSHYSTAQVSLGISFIF